MSEMTVQVVMFLVMGSAAVLAARDEKWGWAIIFSIFANDWFNGILAGL